MTSYSKIFWLLYRDLSWHKISDWILDDENFIGYKAPSRISELMRKYPELIEEKKDGRFMLYRLKNNNGYPEEFFKNYRIIEPAKPMQTSLDINLPTIMN